MGIRISELTKLDSPAGDDYIAIVDTSTTTTKYAYKRGFLGDGLMELTNVTVAEAQQLENIGTSTISAAQWGYLGGLDQDLKTTSSVLFDTLTTTNDIGATGDITGASFDGITSGNLVDKTGTETVSGAWTFTNATHRLQNASPTLQWYETDGSADENYQIRVISGALTFQTQNDAFSSASTKWKIDQDGNIDIANRSRVKVSLDNGSANQDIASGTYTRILFDTEAYDALNEFDSGSGGHYFTAGSAGYFDVRANITYKETTDEKNFRALIYKNGSAVTQSTQTGSLSGDGYLSVQVADVLSLAINDTVSIHTYQDSGANREVQYGLIWTHATIHKLS